MSKYVKGKNCVVSMLVVDTYYPIFCAKSMDFTIDQEEIEITSVNSGSDREYELGMSSAMCNLTGITSTSNDTRLSVLYIMQQAVRRVTQSFKITLTADDAEVKVVSFDGLFRTTSFSKDGAGYSNAGASIRVTGPVNLGDTIDPPTVPTCEIEDTLAYTAVGGETSYSNVLLDTDTYPGLTVLWVTRAGSTLYPTTGTPVGLQFRHVGSTGTIEFDPLNPLNADEGITIQYKLIA